LEPTILLVDDHEVVRKGLRNMVDGHWAICGEACDGKQAIEKVLELHPDLVVMDISMPIMNGIEAVREMRRLQLPVKILILSMHNSGIMADQVIEAGADAFLVKDCGADKLTKTIAQLLRK
jgi:DNA-binding NarL/FixJ family response regulator